jgi:hypothetical protein
MPAAPRRPGQDPFHFLLRDQYEVPEETTNLADTQRHASPRVALNAAKLLRVGGSKVFFYGGKLSLSKSASSWAR